MANPPAGWHPDPLNRHAQRYWDGQQWTEHVADESGNMSTDPLDGGGSGQQETRQEGWGAQSSGEERAAWDDGTTPSWGQGDTTDTTGEGTWGAPAGEAGAAGAATAPATAETTAGVDAGVPAGVDAGVPAGDVSTLPTVEESGLASLDVAAGAVVREGSVVARSAGVTTRDSAHPGCVDLGGSGRAHVAAGGRAIAVLEVPVGGLTIRDDALLAHSADLDRAAATDGIVGYAATTLSGTGWVAVTAPGGVLEVSPVGGVHVTTAALVAWTSDLDVSHAEDVRLDGHGVVLVSAETH